MVREPVDSVVMRHALEDSQERDFARRVEPLVAKLHVGYNYFEPEEFHDLACYFTEGRARTDAVNDGVFRVSKKVDVIRTGSGTLQTMTELSRNLGVARQTLQDWVGTLKLPHRFRGKRKVYNINELRRYLLGRREGDNKGLR